MNIKKILCCLVIIEFCFLSLTVSISSSKSINDEDISQFITYLDSHLIEGVPYVSQETGFFCAFASPTMIFKYMGINTSLAEVLFLSGIGCSISYGNRNVLPGIQVSRDYDFLSSLYNLSFNGYNISCKNESDEPACWNIYWNSVKENISKDIPVQTVVNPFGLKSYRDITNIPDFILDIIPSTHAIILIGYNESNQTVCFNDPAMGALGEPDLGIYMWMDLEDFRYAIWRAVIVHKYFYVHTFNKISDPPEKNIIYKLAYNRNIKRMNGTNSAYGIDIVIGNVTNMYNDALGINSLYIFKNDLLKGVNIRYKTIQEYKKRNKGKIFMIIFGPIFAPKFFSKESGEDELAAPFSMIFIEKKYYVDFLRENNETIPISDEKISLFEKELENWSKLCDNYKVFVRKGLRLSYFRAVTTINDMAKNVNDIIKNEEEIIKSYSLEN